MSSLLKNNREKENLKNYLTTTITHVHRPESDVITELSEPLQRFNLCSAKLCLSESSVQVLFTALEH